MKCHDILELMQREIDADLEAEEQELLHRHLASCKVCQEQFQRLQELSAHLEALPKVSPPFSIVDKLLPELELINQEQMKINSQQAADHSPAVSALKKQSSKRIWISGLVMAACLCIALFALNKNTFSPASEEQEHAQSFSMVTNEDSPGLMEGRSMKALEPEQNGNEAAAMPPDQFDSAAIPEKEGKEESPPDEHEPAEPGQQPGQHEQQADMALLMVDPTLQEQTYPSPDGLYVASLGIDKDEILLDKEGRAYFISKHHWELPWEIEHIEWVSPIELYYILYHAESGEYQYWLIDAEERVETKLDAPLDEGKEQQ